MGRFREEYNLKNEQVFERAQAMLSKNGQYYEGIRVRSVAAQSPEGVWTNFLCMIVAYPKGQAPATHQSINYPENRVRLIEHWLTPTTLMPYLEKISKSVMGTAEGDVSIFGTDPHFRMTHQLPSNNDFGALPGTEYRMDGSNRPSFHVTDDPLLSYEENMPYYSGIDEAVADWVGLKSFHGRSSDSRLGGVILFLPECRAYIHKIQEIENSLEIVIAGEQSSTLPLRIKGGWRSKGKFNNFDQKVTSQTTRISTPDAEEYEIYLIGNDNSTYDYARETTFIVTGTKRVLERQDPSKSDKDRLAEDLQKGETDKIEFKSYIDVDNPESLDSLIETVIAFANTKGGSIYIGVNDYCQVKGIEKEVSVAYYKAKQKGTGDSTDWYIGRLKKVVGDSLSRAIPIQYGAFMVGDHKVLHIIVSEGEEKPYFWMWRNSIYVRHGGSDVIANPYTELPALYSNPRRATNDYEEAFGGLIVRPPTR